MMQKETEETTEKETEKETEETTEKTTEKETITTKDRRETMAAELTYISKEEENIFFFKWKYDRTRLCPLSMNRTRK